MISPPRGTVRHMLVILNPTVPESVCSVSVVTWPPQGSVTCARHMTGGLILYPTVPRSLSQCLLLLDLHRTLWLVRDTWLVVWFFILQFLGLSHNVCCYLTSTGLCDLCKTHDWWFDSLSYSSWVCLTVSVVTSPLHGSVICVRHMTGGLILYPTFPGSVSQCLLLLLHLHMALWLMWDTWLVCFYLTVPGSVSTATPPPHGIVRRMIVDSLSYSSWVSLTVSVVTSPPRGSVIRVRCMIGDSLSYSSWICLSCYFTSRYGTVRQMTVILYLTFPGSVCYNFTCETHNQRFFNSHCLSPWYTHPGGVDVKNQVTYLHTSWVCLCYHPTYTAVGDTRPVVVYPAVPGSVSVTTPPT